MVAVFDFTFFPEIEPRHTIDRELRRIASTFTAFQIYGPHLSFFFFMPLFTRYYAKRFERISSRDYDQLIKEL